MLRRKKRRAAPKRRRKVAKRNPMSAAKRKAAAKKAARTRAANKRKRSLAAKKAARTRKRKSRKRAAPKRSYRRNASKKRKLTAAQKKRRAAALKGIRLKKGRKGKKRKVTKGVSPRPNRRRRVTRRRRSYMRNRPVRRRRIRRRAKRNVGLEMLKSVGAGFAGFLAGRLTANMLARATFLPAAVQPYVPLVGTVGAVALAYYLPKKVKALRVKPATHTALVLGTGIAAADVLFSSLAPASVRQYVGAPPPVAIPGLSGDLSVYEASLRGFGTPPAFLDESGDWGMQPMLPGRSYPVGKSMAEYVQEPLGATVHEAMAEYIQEPGMGEYVVDEDGAVLSGHDELDAGVVSDGLFGDDVDIMALDGDELPFEGSAAAGAAAAAARRMAQIGAANGRPEAEVHRAGYGAACQAIGAGQLSSALRAMVEAEIQKAMGRVQAFTPVQDPAAGAPMAVGPIRAPQPAKWTYGSVSEGGGVFGKSSIGG